ncbi:MAG TPA: sugar phosphate isomerase/epimerase [Mucilaginibacter sp.]|jgi:hypothetical protein
MDFNRRKFLQSAGLLAVGSLASSAMANHLNNFASPHVIGLQLYTVFDQIDDDLSGTLSRINGSGYREIESTFSKRGWYYGRTAKSFKTIVSDAGLVWKSHQVPAVPFKMLKGFKMPMGDDGKPVVLPPMKNLKENMQQLVDEAAEGGVEYLVCAFAPNSTLAETKSTIDLLNKTGEAAKKAGIQFAYYNHDMEFRIIQGKVPYQLILTETDPNNVKMELDLAWAVKGGQDPLELFKNHPGRFPLWHVKDLDSSYNNITPVGKGIIDFKSIFEAKAAAGMKHFFVEHDLSKDPFASIAISYSYLTDKLKV